MALNRYTGDMENWDFKQSTFSKEIRRVNRNRIILAVIVLTAIFYYDILNTFFRAKMYYAGPKEISHAEISEISDPETQLKDFGFSANRERSDVFENNPALKRLMCSKNGSCYVSLKPVSISDSGVEAYTATRKKATVEYVLGELSTGKILLIKRSAIVRLERVQGTIGYLPSDLRAKLLSASEIEDARLLPLIMDATGETFSSVTTDILFSVFLLLIWGLWFFFILRRALDIQRDPAYNRLFMCHGSVEENARKIDEELKSPDVFTTRRLTITENWRLQSKFLSFVVEPKLSADE